MKYMLVCMLCCMSIFNRTLSSHLLRIAYTSTDTPISKIVKSKQQPDLSNYSLCKTDDFKGNKLNKTVWNFRRENDDVDGSIYMRKNAVVKDGYLHLITNRLNEKFSAVSISTQSNQKYHFKYGYFEIRARLPQTPGNVGAFWLQSNGMAATRPQANTSIYGAEIDVFEYSASNKDKLFHSLHWNGYDYKNGAKLTTSENYMAGISNGFHTFALEWTPKEYVVYIDGVEKVRTEQYISHVPEYIILGCGTGGFGGPLNYSGPWPDTMIVDYIKMYQRKPEVRIYGACDGYGWVSDGLRPGIYDFEKLQRLSFFNNEASAIEIPEGWKVIVYDGENLSGDSIILTKDTRCLEELNFNDKISSVRISDF